MHPNLTPTATTDATRSAVYLALGQEYGRRVEQRTGAAVVVTKKWQNRDLVFPHSDIDLRLVLDDPPPNWFTLNEDLAAVQRDLVAEDPVRRRLLEHPPGWAFLRREVAAGLVPAAEIATWSHCHGDRDTVTTGRQRGIAAPWTSADDRFYRGILASRLGGAYRLEVDSADNVVLAAEAYGAHCVAWHYLAPVVFAATSLAARRRHVGKTDALRTHSDAVITRFLDLARTGYRDAGTPQELLVAANRAIDALPPAASPPPDDMSSCPTRAEIVSAVGVLRCRIARYAYYLDPPAGAVTGYLIARETKDLHGATGVLRAGADRLPAVLRDPVEQFLALVPAPPTTRDFLHRFLARLTAHPEVVDRLFSADFTHDDGAADEETPR